MQYCNKKNQTQQNHKKKLYYNHQTKQDENIEDYNTQHPVEELSQKKQNKNNMTTDIIEKTQTKHINRNQMLPPKNTTTNSKKEKGQPDTAIDITTPNQTITRKGGQTRREEQPGICFIYT